jgi:hypothetical protein
MRLSMLIRRFENVDVEDKLMAISAWQTWKRDSSGSIQYPGMQLVSDM